MRATRAFALLNCGKVGSMCGQRSYRANCEGSVASSPSCARSRPMAYRPKIKSSELISREIRPRLPSQKTIGIDIHLDADVRRHLHLGEPLPHHRLDVDL